MTFVLIAAIESTIKKMKFALTGRTRIESVFGDAKDIASRERGDPVR